MPLNCGALSIMNGCVEYTNTTLGPGTVATFNCEDGYTLVGESSTTCLIGENNNGVWSSNTPICQGQLNYKLTIK